MEKKYALVGSRPLVTIDETELAVLSQYKAIEVIQQ